MSGPETEIWLINPILNDTGAVPARIARHRIHIVVSQYEERSFWCRWGKQNGAHIIESQVPGYNLQSDWPSIVCGGPTGNLRPPARQTNPGEAEVLPPKVDLANRREILASLRGIRLDGDLDLSLPIATRSALSELHLGLVLRHRLDFLAQGKQFSAWEIPGLRIGLFFDGNDRLRLQLSDRSKIFVRREIDSSYHGDSSKIRVRRLSRDGDYECSVPSLGLLRFSKGALFEIVDLHSNRFRVRGLPGAISYIELIRGEVTEPMLSARYDDTGNVVGLDTLLESPQVFEWQNGLLRTWQPAPGIALKFDYSDSLLTHLRICGGSTKEHTFAWSDLPSNFANGFVSSNRVFLARYDDRAFDVSVNQRGIHIMSSRRGNQQTIIYNPASGKVVLAN